MTEDLHTPDFAAEYNRMAAFIRSLPYKTWVHYTNIGDLDENYQPIMEWIQHETGRKDLEVKVEKFPIIDTAVVYADLRR